MKRFPAAYARLARCCFDATDVRGKWGTASPEYAAARYRLAQARLVWKLAAFLDDRDGVLVHPQDFGRERPEAEQLELGVAA